MSQSYTPEFKKKIIRLHIEEGHTYKRITAEYGVSKSSYGSVQKKKSVKIIQILPESFPFNALCGLFIISTVPLQEWLIYAIFQGCFCRYFSEYSDKCRFRHSFFALFIFRS